MAYTPNPADSLQPVASVKASTAAEEFRALKAYIATLAGLSPSPSFPAMTVSQLNGGQLAGLRNRLINGNFDLWQRNTNFTNPAAYTADRWYCSTTNLGVSRSGVSGSSGRYALLATPSNATNVFNLYQPLEDSAVRSIAGKQVTFSVSANCASGAQTVTLHLEKNATANTMTGGAFSAITQQAFVLSSTPQRLSITATIPDDATAVGVAVRVSSQNTANGVGLGFWEAQLEVGSVITPFEYRPVPLEFMLCSRFYQKSFGLDTAPAQNVGGSGAVGFVSQVTANLYDISMRFVPTLRIDGPAIVTYSPNAASANFSTNTDTPIATLPTFSAHGFTMRAGTTQTAGRAYSIHWTADAEL